jgi:amidase
LWTASRRAKLPTKDDLAPLLQKVKRTVSNWLDHSIVARNGIGWSKKSRLHDLTEALQGKYHYTIGPYSAPVLTVQPGDRIRIETRDAFEGVIRTEQDKPTAKLRMPFVNPQNGPIMIDGAEPGDAIAVHIESMLPRGENPCGTCCMIPHFGALTGIGTLNEPLPELTRKIHVDEKHVRWSTRVTLPYNPHIGTLSTSPEIDSINSLTPDSHGGNMDLPDMGPGSITYLPVRSPGARLFIGDAHACQGDGEVCGTAVEFPSTTTIRVDVIKGWTIDWPRLEREDFIMAIGSARPLEDATRIAYRELVLWMEAEYGFDRWDAYMMLSQCGRIRLGNFVDPKYTVGAGILKSWLAA